MAQGTPCSVDGCDNPVSRSDGGRGSRGMCWKHYQRWKKHGTTELAPRPTLICSAEGCGRPVGNSGARGMCPKHYSRWRVHGTAESRPRKAAETQCSVEGCDGAGPIARGWCHKHYMHWYMYGDPLRKPVVERPCSVEGCGLPHDAHGWCQGHKVRWQKTGDVQADVPIRDRSVPRVCSLPDCDEPHFARGFCQVHYSRLRKTGTTDGPPQYGDTCSIGDCDAASFAKGLCKRCYSRNKAREWRAEHPGYDAAATGAWRAAWYAQRTPEERRERVARDRAQRLRVRSERVDYEAILAEHGMVCHICWWDIASRDDLHMDHVIPLARGGPHTYSNIRPAHRWCNLWKRARLMSEL